MKSLVVLLIVAMGSMAQAGAVDMTSSGTVGAGDGVVRFQGANIIVATLPSCGAGNDGEQHIFKGVTNSHAATVNAASGQTIELNASGEAVGQYQATFLSCDGSLNEWVHLGYW